MLLKLHARGLRSLSDRSPSPFVARISSDPQAPAESRSKDLLLVTAEADELPPGFRGYLLYKELPVAYRKDVYLLGAEHRHVRPGDVVRIDPGRGTLHSLYRASSRFNTFLVTERCDNFCVMCSQPPRDHDDSWLLDELEQVIGLISTDGGEIGITGGEPALLGDRLLHLLGLLRDHLPRTAVHLLTNGRRLSDRDFAQALARVRHPDLMLGIPLYSDLPEEHDYVVQAKGAFDETVRAILNLKRRGVRVEIRFVIHRETAARIEDFARFVVRNLTFVDHVAFMGLEPIGFARLNLDQLWIDPLDYQHALVQATSILDRAGMAVSIYNHQLCTLEGWLHKFARQSISDWKNRYFDECDGCMRRSECGGFFASSTARRSRGIAAFR